MRRANEYCPKKLFLAHFGHLSCSDGPKNFYAKETGKKAFFSCSGNGQVIHCESANFPGKVTACQCLKETLLGEKELCVLVCPAKNKSCKVIWPSKWPEITIIYEAEHIFFHIDRNCFFENNGFFNIRRRGEWQ